jgi:hypothetical protein
LQTVRFARELLAQRSYGSRGGIVESRNDGREGLLDQFEVRGIARHLHGRARR